MAKKVSIKAEDVRELAEYFCTPEEIAGYFGCSAKTITRNYSHAMKQGREKGKAKLRKLQWESVEKGNLTLLAWFSKQFLEQSDSIRGNINEGEDSELHKVAHATMVQLAGAGRTTSGDTAIQE